MRRFAVLLPLMAACGGPDRTPRPGASDTIGLDPTFADTRAVGRCMVPPMTASFAGRIVRVTDTPGPAYLVLTPHGDTVRFVAAEGIHEQILACDAGPRRVAGTGITPVSARDSATAAAGLCQEALRERFGATASPPSPAMRRDPATGAYAGRGEASVPDAAGGAAAQPFVCLLDLGASTRARILVRSDDPAAHDAAVRDFGL